MHWSGEADAAPKHAGQHGRVARGRSAVVATGMVVLAGCAAWLMWPSTRPSPVSTDGPWSVDQYVGTVLAWVGLGLAVWLGLGALLALLGHLPGTVGRIFGRLGNRVTPRLVRRLLAMVLGASVGSLALPVGTAAGTAAGTTPSAATTRSGTTSGSPEKPGQADLADRTDQSGASGRAAAPLPGWVPSSTGVPAPGYVVSSPALPPGPVSPHVSPAPHPAPQPGPGSKRPAPPPPPGWSPSRPPVTTDPERTRLLSPGPRVQTATIDRVTVRRGDTLWAIAARHLGPQASDAEIAREWPRWYAANRELIGSDPNLIRPGHQLVPPAEEAHR